MEGRSTSQQRRAFDRVLDILTLALAVVALAVAINHFFLREGPQARADAPDPREVERRLVGRHTDTVSLIPRGDVVARPVGFRGDAPQLILLFRSDCRACRLVEPAWLTLASRIDSRIKIHAITTESLATTFDLFALPRVQVWYAASAAAFAEAFPSPFVPMTLLVSPEGIITYARVGALTSAALDSVGQTLAISSGPPTPR